MNFKDFNFEHPMWLWGLSLIPLGFAWYKYWCKISKANLGGLSKFIDQNLLPYLLINKTSQNTSKTKNNGLIYTLLTFCIIIALANPRWNFDEIDAYQTTASMVVLFDLSASMNATDIAPSRIVRARQNLEDLLNLSKGLKFGLIGFAGNAHLISPITDDIQTVRTYIPALDTDLTNLQGNSLHTAFRMGAELLSNEPGERKSMLLISDGNFTAVDFAKELAQLQAANIQVHVMGVGTATGAPYKDNNGALHKQRGKTITSKLNSKALQNIAKQGHGVYTEAVYNDSGVRAILRNAEHVDSDQKVVAGKVRQWQDKYYWFLVPAAMLLLYLIRQRVLYLVAIIISIGLFTPSKVWADPLPIFQNSEQKAQKQYVDANFKAAAELFKDPYNKGVALYRDGEYAAAEKYFKIAHVANSNLAALYNAGNAQMQQQKWRAAIKSYETVIQQDSEHFAAIHNLEIAKAMLAQNKDNEKEQEQDSQQEENENQQQQQQDGGQSQQEKQNQEQSKQNEQQQSKDSQQQQAKNQELPQQADENSQDNTDETNAANLKNAELAKIDEERAQQWLNRIDSDIKIFLKNKFYIEDVISAQ